MCEAYDPTVGCEFPYLNRFNETGCRTTYAEYLGTTYLLYHIFFGVFSSLLFIATIVKNFLIHYHNPKWNESKYQFKKVFLGIIALMSFCLFIQFFAWFY